MCMLKKSQENVHGELDYLFFQYTYARADLLHRNAMQK